MQQQFEEAVRLHQSGQVKGAAQRYAEILRSHPTQPVVNARMAMALTQLNQHRDALRCYQIAIQGLPKEVELLAQGAKLASQLGNNDLAKQWLAQALEVAPQNAQANEMMAGVLIALHQEAEALKFIKQALKAAPQSASAHNLKGMIESRTGNPDKAYKSFQKALSLDPGQLGVVRNLIIHGKGKKEPLLEQVIPQLEKQYAHPQLAPPIRMNLAYVLFMYYEKTDPKKAFGFLKAGNDINRQVTPYDHQQTIQTFSALLSLFSGPLADAVKERALSEDAPIFILGMPRSGTTLIEQILSSHTEVGAEGEIEDLRRQFDGLSQTILDEELAIEARADACISAVKAYLEGVQARQEAHYFTDKMPYNFLLIGLIALALPNAHIIHCTRDPLETCYSIYKQNFSGSHAYTNNLEELGQYFNLYQTMMNTWQAQFPERIYDANYERMVANSEQEIEKLLAFCGLEMQAQCLAFYKNDRTVRTASVAQVRRPIYKDALKASTPLQEELAPLSAILASGDGGALA